MALQIASVVPSAEARLPEDFYGFLVFVSKEVDGLLDVEVLGDVPDGETQKDLRVIFIVEEKYWSFFHFGLSQLTRLERPALPVERLQAMIAVLGIDVMTAFHDMAEDRDVILRDVYLFPKDWRERIPEIARMFGDTDDRFVQGLAETSIELSQDGPPNRD